MTLIWTDDDYLRDECEQDAKLGQQPAPVCASCGYEITDETDETNTARGVMHTSCAEHIWNE